MNYQHVETREIISQECFEHLNFQERTKYRSTIKFPTHTIRREESSGINVFDLLVAEAAMGMFDSKNEEYISSSLTDDSNSGDNTSFGGGNFGGGGASGDWGSNNSSNDYSNSSDSSSYDSGSSSSDF